MNICDDLTDICLSIINSSLNVFDGFERVIDLTKNNREGCSVLLDVLNCCEGEIAYQKDKDGAKDNFLKFVSLLQNTVIPEELLRVELECLDATKPEFTRQLIRFKTRIYFKQSKFNLLREETEGYAKLITELLEAENHTYEHYSTIMKQRVLSLIGQFNLDPNRVTDVILECFEHCPKHKTFFIKLLKEINIVPEYLCAILGFKYTFYQGSNKKTPYSLYTLTATLIQYELLDTMKILSYMIPKTDEIKDGHRARMANAKERSSKAETISTAQMPIIEARSIDDNPSTSVQTQSISFTTVISIQENDDAILAEPFSEENVLATNQKLGLACALLESGNWKQAQLLIDRLPEYYAVQASPRLCRALCRIIERSINDFYMEVWQKSVFFDSIKEKTKRNDTDECISGDLDKTKNWNDMANLSNVLWYLGPRIAYQPTTVVKLLRILTVYYQKVDRKEIERNEKLIRLFTDVVAECILPSLTLSETNVALSEEMWNLLQLIPYTWRYWMYAKWNSETARHPELYVMKGKVYGRTKYVLKRLSKETVKVMGRHLSKLCHIHPTTVLSYLLSQVQTFDNLINPVVDGLRYLTSLEFDVLTYCIIAQLADPSKQALKSTDATISPWLQALGTLVGSLYRKYPLELNGMLEYVLNQLKCCKGFDLLLLREIVQNMSWIESTNQATKDQLDALAGGEVLRQEAGGYSTARNKRAAHRLRDALSVGDLAVGLCILIAQQKEYIAYKESDKLPLKLVGEMVDQCSDTFQQLVSFLNSYLKNDDYCRRFPMVRELITDYHLRIEAVMYMTRPIFMSKVNETYDAFKKQARAEAGDAKLKLESRQKSEIFNRAFDERIDELTNDFKIAIPKFDDKVSRKLFSVFWSLSTYDIDVPNGAYEKAIDNVKKQIVDENKTKRGEDRLKQLETKLREEQKKQTEHVERVKAWLVLSKDSLFEENQKPPYESFMQSCILPRALFSEFDATFCGKFFILLHEQRTAFFPTLIIIARTFDDILPLISGLTENEANSFGRYLEILLSYVVRWHESSETFDKELQGFPGIVTKTPVSYDTFKKLCYRWQIRLTKAFVNVLNREDTDYVIIRNCLIVMARMSTCFPQIQTHINQLETAVLAVRDREKGKRDDLSLKAASFVARLKTRNIKIYAQPYDYAPIPRKPAKKEEKVKPKKIDEEDGEPVLKKVKINENNAEDNEDDERKVKVKKEDKSLSDSKKENHDARTNGMVDKEKKKRTKIELYTAPKGNRVVSKKEDKPSETTEEGEVESPSPPPKKTRIEYSKKEEKREEVVDKEEKHRKKDKKEDRENRDRRLPEKDHHSRDRKSGTEKKDKRKDKENGEIKKEKSHRHEKKEEKEVAGPTLPENLIRSSRDEKKNQRISTDEVDMKSKKDKKERKEEAPKASKISEAVHPRSRDRDRGRDMEKRLSNR